MKNIFIVIVILFTSSYLLATTKREFKVIDNDVEILIGYSYEKGQKCILINGEFTNISDTLIYVRKFNEGEWNKRIKYEYDKKIHGFPPIYKYIEPRFYFEQRDTLKLHELHVNEKIKFSIEVEFASRDYEYLVHQNYEINFSYFKYSPLLSKLFKITPEDRFTQTLFLGELSDNSYNIRVHVRFD